MPAKQNTPRRRVVITGMGCVTPLGAVVDQVWSQLVAGRSAVGRITLFDASHLPVQIAAEISNWDMSDVDEDPDRWRHHPRQSRFAIAAAIKAHRDAAVQDADIDPVRLGIYLGCGEAFHNFADFSDAVRLALDNSHCNSQAFMQAALTHWNADEENELRLNMPAAHLAARFNAQGPCANCIVACATTSQAIGEASEIIRRGDADVMLAGGSHSMIHPFGLTGFIRLAALSMQNDPPTKAIRPFDRNRDGFVIGEGAAMFVLEDLQHARRRGVPIQAEILGFGNTQDAYRLTDPHPLGRGAAGSMATALADASLTCDQIDYINAHGTGTLANDRTETMAIKTVFGEQAHKVPISSTKSMMGHCTTAAGAVELLACIKSIQSGIVHPTINYETPDPECDLDYVPNVAREVSCRNVLSNSFGFGGQNVSLVVSRFDA